MTSADVTIAELRDELQAEKRANHQLRVGRRHLAI